MKNFGAHLHSNCPFLIGSTNHGRKTSILFKSPDNSLSSSCNTNNINAGGNQQASCVTYCHTLDMESHRESAGTPATTPLGAPSSCPEFEITLSAPRPCISSSSPPCARTQPFPAGSDMVGPGAPRPAPMGATGPQLDRDLSTRGSSVTRVRPVEIDALRTPHSTGGTSDAVADAHIPSPTVCAKERANRGWGRDVGDGCELPSCKVDELAPVDLHKAVVGGIMGGAFADPGNTSGATVSPFEDAADADTPARCFLTPR
mmetsp:Transcript_4151/g.11706  ORF Transcript_4151/g.11706 Transcript_4151/m.11706 type:complete len:259 (+) Transcript_4151:302-1078(+)